MMFQSKDLPASLRFFRGEHRDEREFGYRPETGDALHMESDHESHRSN